MVMIKMFLYVVYVSLLLFCTVDACDLSALGECTKPTTIDPDVTQELLTKDLIQAKGPLCSSMDRDEFEKLASCANEDDACSALIFKTQNPYNISRELIPFLKDSFQAEDQRIKLVFDMVCEPDCEEYVETISMEEAPETESPCTNEENAVEVETGRLFNKYSVTKPEDLTNMTSEELKTYCGTTEKYLTCYFEALIPSCNVFKKAADRTKIGQLVGPSLQANPILSQCQGLLDNVLDTVLELDTSSAGKELDTSSAGKELDTSSAGQVQISSLVFAIALGWILFR